MELVQYYSEHSTIRAVVCQNCHFYLKKSLGSFNTAHRSASSELLTDVELTRQVPLRSLEWTVYWCHSDLNGENISLDLQLFTDPD